ncbi:MAG: hypothetical protein FJX45_14945, partial [Alphaproteobacteria bacterium]|nr:hypothetical protein [Alphaproteobacteria bacterium]
MRRPAAVGFSRSQGSLIMDIARKRMEIEAALRRAGESEAGARPAPCGEKAGAAPVAIVGVSGFLPQNDTIDDFWRALDADACLIEPAPAERFDAALRIHGGFIPDVAGFDPAFFGMPPGEAATMDPRLRLLLMSAYRALVDAGHAPGALRQSRTGVFVAAQDDEYIKTLEEAGVDVSDRYAQRCLLANLISYTFDFRGASEVVDAQCAGAAVALHRAVSALRAGEIDQALVCAATLLLRHEPFALLTQSGQLSKTDRVRAFAPDADGHLRAEGVGAVLLKPLPLALADGDNIYALIRATAVNYNGQGGASIAAPNPESHAAVVEACYRAADVDPRDIGYIEAQGMGNALADLSEWRAFNSALERLARARGVASAPGQCLVSTLKPTMGHMESAAALGALFKIIRALRTGVVHGVAGFTGPHPDMAQGGPCAIAARTQTWPRAQGPRLAGLHAYGMGGTNAHVLIEAFEAGEARRAPPVEGPRAFLLSAHTPSTLTQMARDLCAWIDAQPTGDAASELRDIAWTLRVGRDAQRERLAIVARTREELRHALARHAEGCAAPRLHRGTATDAPAPATDDSLDARAIFWSRGGAADFSMPDDAGARRVRLPAYPFDREPYWVGAASRPQDRAAQTPARRDGVSLAALLDLLGGTLGRAPESIDADQPLVEIGIDSALGLKLLRTLARRLGVSASARDLLAHPTPRALAGRLAEL